MKFVPKSIGLFYPTLENLGGIERVIESQARIFSQRGIQVWIITERPVVALKSSLAPYAKFFVAAQRDDEAEASSISAFVNNKKLDIVILHGAHYDSAESIAKRLKNCGVRVILNIHFSFPTPLYLTGDECQIHKHLQVARLCDTVTTVSAIDAVFWRSLGVCATHVQNPIKTITVDKQACHHPKPSRRNILWIGRMMEPKQPVEALLILKEILKVLPDVRLTMLGGTISSRKTILNKAKNLGVFNNVRIIPECLNVHELYAEADIHLLTSLTESFCLVLAEAKSLGIPTAMYEIPFLELVADGKGILSTPYGKHALLAEKIVQVLTHEEEWEQLSHDALDSIKAFNDDEVYASWLRAFVMPPTDSNTPTQLQTQIICNEFYKAWMFRMQKDLWKINLWKDFEKLIGHRFSSWIGTLLLSFFQCLRKAKQHLRN